MKKYLLAIAGIACLCFTSCDNKNALDEDDSQLFEATYPFKNTLTPQSVATQVVAGTNYKFICTDNSENAVKVVIFKPLPNQGDPKVSNIEPVTEYDGIIDAVKKGIEERWQTASPENIGVSYIYQYCSPSMGFAKKDINGDGIVELLLGDDMEGTYAIYDIFTYDALSGKVKHVFCGGERDCCTFNGSGVVCRNGSNSASDSFTKYYKIENGELTELGNVAVEEDLKIINLEKFIK